ncbi:response regulator [Sphingomonas oligophenolica]|uniref:histidine kinase n=1 Tax=Sphingomonas oligophenolica TaxID=301154 RepID=A0ABU9XY77_9SPHN
MEDAPAHQPPGKWFRGTTFKVEAAIFLLLVATFAAMLGQNAIIRQRLTLAPEAGTFAPYAYSDHDNAGASSISLNPAILSWTCTLRSGFAYPYCGYGMLFDPADNTKGRVFSNYETITLRLIYHGPPGHLKLLLKNFDPKYSRAGAGDSTKPNVAEFAVVDGENEIHLTRDQFAVDQWWATSHHLSPEQAKPEFGNVIAVDILSGSGATLGTFSVAVQSIVFEGVYLSSAQWYLVIISVWLVLTAIFLVYRMFRVRRGYEDRQQRQVAESRELVAARTEAEAASAAKSQFLANMSHELRTPLNAILGYAQLLRSDGLTDRQLSAVQTINQSGEHLLALITDLLDLSKVEAGRLELLPAPFDLRATVDNVAQMIRLRAEEKDLRFIVEISDDVPRHLVGDRKRIRQVLINLLGNATKFTTAGEVRLTVSTVSWEGGNVRLRFDVLDTGPGIRSDQLNLIFQPFEQVGSARDRIGGTGLGLSITRQIVEVMEGQIDVMSTVGKGSRFRVEASFPLAAVELPAPGAASGKPAGGAGCEVLVVDDVAANRTLLRDVLENRGYRVREAADGLEAVELAEAAAPDLILMDLKMPVLDGLEAMRRLQHRQTLRMIPIIAISANPTAEMEAEVRAAGAEGLLAKPIDLTQLHRCIEDLLVRRQEDGIADGRQPMTIPPADQMIRLLTLARTGNMRAVRTEASTILNLDPQYRPFALRLEALAAAYQSPAVLRLIEQHIEAGEAA